jgi:hypothetical protein
MSVLIATYGVRLFRAHLQELQPEARSVTPAHDGRQLQHFCHPRQGQVDDDALAIAQGELSFDERAAQAYIYGHGLEASTLVLDGDPNVDWNAGLTAP